MENKTFVPDLGVSSVFDSAWGLTKKHFLPIFLLYNYEKIGRIFIK